MMQVSSLYAGFFILIKCIVCKQSIVAQYCNVTLILTTQITDWLKLDCKDLDKTKFVCSYLSMIWSKMH